MAQVGFDEGTVGTTGSALQIAVDVAAALPPPWDATTPLVSTFADLFNFFFAPASDPAPNISELAAIFTTVLQQEFTNSTIQAQTADLNTIVNVFNGSTYNATDPIPPSLEAGLSEEQYSHFQMVYYNLLDWVNGNAHGGLPGLLNIVSQMQSAETGDICTKDTNQQAAFLPTFVLAVTIYLLLAKYLIAMVAAAGVEAADLPPYAEMPIFNLTSATCLNQPPSQGWIAYAQAVSQAFAPLVAARLNLQQIPNPIDYYAEHNGTYYVYFQDFGEPVEGFNPWSLSVELNTYRGGNFGNYTVPWPGNVPFETVEAANVVFAVQTDNSQDDFNSVQSLRNQYHDLMLQTIYNNYFNPGDIANTIQTWNSILQNNLQGFSPIPSSI